MRAIILFGYTLALLWPVQAGASLMEPDVGAGWYTEQGAVVSAKRGRAAPVHKARGREIPETIAARPEKPHTIKQFNVGPDNWNDGIWGAGKDLGFGNSHRKGLSLTGQIQLLPPEQMPDIGPSIWRKFGVFEVVATVFMAMIGLITIGLLAGRDPAAQGLARRGPHTRPAHSPHSRRWLRESSQPPLC